MSLPDTPEPESASVPSTSIEFCSALVASSGDAIVATTLDGTIVMWNAGATRTYGYDAGEMVGRPLSAIVPTDDVDELHETLELLATGARVEPFDAVRVHHDGRTLDVSVTASPVLDTANRVIGASWVERDVSGRRHVERMISHLAFHDPLTGLANRALLDDRLQHSLERTRRAGGLVAVVYLDLDDFKQVNDRLGHPAGDRLLQLVATRLQSLLRPEDTLARVGGDEFVVVSDRVPSLEAALAIADRLQHALTPPFDFDSANVLVTASIGVAVGDAHAEADRVLAHADRAMYTAKARGGSQVATFATPVG